MTPGRHWTRHSWFTGGDTVIHAAGSGSAAGRPQDPFLRLLPDLFRGVAAVISEPSRHCTVELQALPSRIGQVRRIISAQLRYWHLDPLIDQAALGVTELLTNVHRHAQPDKSCTVEIELLLERLTVSVHDHDPRLPTVREPSASSTSGRGLALIAAVSESWGSVRGAGPGKSSGSPFRRLPEAPRSHRTRCTGPPPTGRSSWTPSYTWRAARRPPRGPRWSADTPGPAGRP